MNKNAQKEILDSIDIITERKIKKSTPQILYGIVDSVDSNNNICNITTSNTTYNLPYYGGVPVTNKKSPIVVPAAGISQAFVVGGATGEESAQDNRYYFIDADNRISRDVDISGQNVEMVTGNMWRLGFTNDTDGRRGYISTSTAVNITNWNKAVLEYQGCFFEGTGGTQLSFGISNAKFSHEFVKITYRGNAAGNNKYILDISDITGNYFITIYGFLGGGTLDRWYNALITKFYLEK